MDIKIIASITKNRIRVMVSVLASSVVDRHVGSIHCRVKHWYLLIFSYARNIKEKKSRLVGSELG